MDAPLWGDTGGHTGTAPTHLHQTTQCAPTALHCTFDSPHQPHGVSIPHRIAHSIAPNHTVCPLPRSGYTFDSAGLASATQPTLGNGCKRGGLPTTWVVLSFPHTNDATPR